jgi:hypothetical protein
MKMTPFPRGSKFDEKRVPDPDFVPDEQAIRVLEYIWKYNMLTENQLMELEGIKYRRVHQIMGKLFNNGYVNKANPKVRSRYDYMFWVLSRKGARLIANRLGIERAQLDWFREPRWDQVEHDVRVADFNIILDMATRGLADLRIGRFLTDTQFRSWQHRVSYVTMRGNKREVNIYPDAMVELVRETQGKSIYYRLFLELEVSDKSNPRFADQKILSRLAYIQSDVFFKEFHANAGAFLYLCKSRQKMDSYLKIAASVLTGDQGRTFFFTLYDYVNTETVLFEPIWFNPGNDDPLALFS